MMHVASGRVRRETVSLGFLVGGVLAWVFPRHSVGLSDIGGVRAFWIYYETIDMLKYV